MGTISRVVVCVRHIFCNMSEKSTDTMGDKVKKIHKPVLVFLCVLVIVLSIAGAAISVYSYDANDDASDMNAKPEMFASQLKTAQDLFICIIIFSILALLLLVFVKFQKSGEASKYEI